MSILQQTVFQASPSATLTGFTVPVGTTAIAIVFSHEQANASRTPTELTIDGVAATNKGRHNHSSGYPFGEGWYMTSGFGSFAANPVLTVTPGASGNNYYTGTIFCLDNVDTNTANWVEVKDSDTNANAMSVSQATTVGDIIVGVMTDTVGGNSFTTDSPLTEVAGSDLNFNSTASRSVSFYHTATTTPTAIGGRNANTNGTNYQVLYALVIPVDPGGPVIVSTSDDTPTDGASITLTVTGAGASQGTVTLGGVAQTVTAWSDTSVTITVSLGANKYGVNAALVLTTDDDEVSAGHNVQVQPAAGVKYITTSGTLADPENRLTTIPDDIVSGYQIEARNVTGGTIADLTLYQDASYSAGTDIVSFQYRVHNGTVWGDFGTEYPNSVGIGYLHSLARPLAIPLAVNFNEGL